jgi:hypothetical protein
VEEMMGTGQRWHVMEEMCCTTPWRGGQKWPELLHMAEKHLKKHKENKGKNR